ncbi:MAG: cobaltochelatase subunit CobT [Gammaproteobacteria bacterium]|nr:MAG: cobaltochelatase subunit CobT [Gammaproteobacteria bacterium]PIE37311.1 MAG: cobaltochelatase subunit CobT [Gammaproteobacteria bacterium]
MHGKGEQGNERLTAVARVLADDAALTLDEAASGERRINAARRGLGDAESLRHRHHDAALHALWRPASPLAAALFDVLEKTRHESLGAGRWSGVQRNLDARYPDRDLPPVVRELAALAADAFRGGSVTSIWLEALSRHTASQERFARLAAIAAMELAELGDGASRRQLAAAATQDAGLGRDVEHGPRVTGTQEMPDESGDESDPGDARGCERDADTDVELISDPEGNRGLDASTEDAGDGVPDALFASESDAALAGAEASYRAYTHVHDRVVMAGELATRRELLPLRATLDEQLALNGRVVSRLAARLRRRLLARQRRHWQHDLDEGQLDTSRLTRVVVVPDSPLAFRRESEAEFRDTIVTLLVDNSRSMLGRPITTAACCADILMHTLERCGVAVEVLGFTTGALHGGESLRLWQASGQPARPGRMNDLRHIIYKSADMSARSARLPLALMLGRELLKQNIDGEALLWAASRLERRRETRRILVMISDGAPVDTATLQLNGEDYLERHLGEVVRAIDRAGRIELLAIGIGHDVSGLYDRAMRIDDVRELGPVLFGKLHDLLLG